MAISDSEAVKPWKRVRITWKETPGHGTTYYFTRTSNNFNSIRTVTIPLWLQLVSPCGDKHA